MSALPIGMFDSGVGGLSLMREVMRQLPNESILYLGDTNRLPYGNKSAETIIKYSFECGQFLQKLQIKLLIVACNTATSYALPILEKYLDMPVIGVIETTAKEATLATNNYRLAILATQATINSKVYEKHIRQLLPQAHLISLACPLFVPLVEKDLISHPIAPRLIKKHLKVLHGSQIDTVVLGCTHYPFLRSLIQNEMGSSVYLIDSTDSCTKHVCSLLNEKNLKAPAKNNVKHYFYVTGDPIKFKQVGEKLLKIPMKNLQKINL